MISEKWLKNTSLDQLVNGYIWRENHDVGSLTNPTSHEILIELEDREYETDQLKVL